VGLEGLGHAAVTCLNAVFGARVPLMAISGEDFTRFLTANGNYKCTFCGNGLYLINVGLQPNPVIPVEMMIPSIGLSEGHKHYGIVCSNCGRTDLFNLVQIGQWLAKHPPGVLK
jgi:hypothetical protein